MEVSPEDARQRLDRWFRRRYPGLAHGRLEKLLRTGQIRVNGKRARAGTRLAAGDRIRVPPLSDSGEAEEAESERRAAAPPRPAEAEALRDAVLYRDADVIALDKPPGLPVQGGSRVVRHLDAMLDALRFDADETPRLAHRLDRDTSGVLLLARHARAARALATLFRGRRLRKLYWALVVGRPITAAADPLAAARAIAREIAAAS